MKPKIIGDARDHGDGLFAYTINIDCKTHVTPVEILCELSSLVPECSSYADTQNRAYRIRAEGPCRLHVWLFRHKVVTIDAATTLSDEECALEVMHTILRRDRRYKNLRRMLENLQLLDDAQQERRDPIPDAVRMFVWQRDQGRCVRCGSQASLEFDHIIPVIKGGSNTERNLQLLCEDCNRTKAADI